MQGLPWKKTLFPDTGVPTMLSSIERRYLTWMTEHCFRGSGHILEIGPWLGASTQCLAEGLRRNAGAGSWKVHAVDNFVWRPFMERRAGISLETGTSFQSHFEQNLRPWADLVVAHRRALPDDKAPLDALAASIVDTNSVAQPLFSWDVLEPIEVLFVDGAKSWTGMVYLLQDAGAHLVSDALIVCQDYKYWGCYWVAVLMELLSEHAELEHVVAENTVTFRLRSALPTDLLRALPQSVHELGPAHLVSHLDNASRRLSDRGDRKGAAILQLCKVRALGNLGRWDEARAALRHAESQWPILAPTANLDQARAWLAAERGEKVAPSLGLQTKLLVQNSRRLPGRIRRRFTMRATR